MAGEWYKVPVKDIIGGQTPIVVLADDPVEKAVDTLIHAKVSSLPVWDNTTKSWAGSFDYADLAAWIIQIVRNPNTPPATPTSPTAVPRMVTDHLARLPTPVSALTDLSLGNPWATVTEDEELGAIVGVLGGGVRRVGVIGKNSTNPGGLIGVLTQSLILKCLLHHQPPFASLPPLLKTSISQLGLTTHKTVVALDSRKRVLDALEAMVEGTVQAVPVMENGRIVGNISMSDIRHILHPPQSSGHVSHSPTHLLSQPLLPFVHAVAQAAALERPDAGDRFPVWTVRGTETLQRVWGLCVATGGHRVWGVDETGKPAFVVSLTDILRVLAESIPKSYFAESAGHPGLGSGQAVESGAGNAEMDV